MLNTSNFSEICYPMPCDHSLRVGVGRRRFENKLRRKGDDDDDDVTSHGDRSSELTLRLGLM